MLKVLIADDEKKICTLIENLIDWPAMGLEIVSIVNNGLDAFSQAQALRPDIMIADIKMPGMDGIQLIEKLIAEGIKSRLIIISGYKHFEYAHSAINFGVESYLLKPIDKGELEQALLKIIKSIKTSDDTESIRRHRKIQRHFLENIINKLERADIEIGSINSKYELDFRQGAFQALFFRIDKGDQPYDTEHIYGLFMEELEAMEKPADTECVFRDSPNGILAIINYESSRMDTYRAFFLEVYKRLKKISDKFSNMRLTMGVGLTVASLNNLYVSIRSSMDAVKLRMFLGQGRIIDMNELDCYHDIHDFEDLGTVGVQIEVAVESFDTREFSEIVSQLIKRNAAGIEKNSILLLRILEYIEEKVVAKLKEMGMAHDLLKKMHEEFDAVYFGSITETGMIHQYKELIVHYIGRLKEEKEDRKTSAIRKAQKLIAENFNKQISLESIAEQIALSPAYLSTLFKAELGVNFSDYLVQCRINMAKKLLKSSDYSIQEIADAVGYRDAKYFSKLFHKSVGLKPSVYKKLHS